MNVGRLMQLLGAMPPDYEVIVSDCALDGATVQVPTGVTGDVDHTTDKPFCRISTTSDEEEIDELDEVSE